MENHPEMESNTDDYDLDLNLSLPYNNNTRQPPQPTPPAASHPPTRGGARPRRSHAATKPPTSPTILPAHRWSTNRRATVHSLHHLLQEKITTISGTVICKRCERQDEIEFDLVEKFDEIGNYVRENKDQMRHRAPPRWMYPVLPRCRFCQQEKCAKPVFPAKKKNINWLFLLLGQMLGCCTLEQLKYFCKHTKNHRTGAKDRVLYLTYLALLKQLDPTGPYDR